MSTENPNLAETLAQRQINRRAFVKSLAVAGLGGNLFTSVYAQTISPPVAVKSINHMTLSVSDPKASLAWYQGLFGMPIVARQGGTIVLQVGDGPQFIAIGGSVSDDPRITHYCLALDDFNSASITSILEANGVKANGRSGAMESRVRMRGADFGGAPEGTPELYFRDPDGIMGQLQDSSYCGGSGILGEECLSRPEPAPTGGLIKLQEFNHFTLFVKDQQRAVRFYQSIFGLTIDTYQGSMPILRVGSGREFLALAEVPALSGRIHHASLNIENFGVDRIFSILEGYGLTILGEAGGATGPLQAYVTMRGPERGGAEAGTPEVYFTDPDGILLQIQDSRYCGGAGYYGEECGTIESPTGRTD
jgi:catechol 2,3-dioxygenase-like lactoylglutathione lyase family enzyme